MIEICLQLANQRGHEPAQECINCRRLKIKKTGMMKKYWGEKKTVNRLCRVHMIVNENAPDSYNLILYKTEGAIVGAPSFSVSVI